MLQIADRLKNCIGVVVTLGYLVIQIRQNNRMLNSNLYGSWVQTATTTLDMLADHSETLAPIYGDLSSWDSVCIGCTQWANAMNSTTAAVGSETVEFDRGENHGVNVFCRSDDGEIFHTYSSFNRGIEEMNGAFGYFDLLPKDRAW